MPNESAPMSAESGRSLGERAAACGRLEARGRSWEYEAVLGGHGSPKVRVKAVEHWVRVGWKRRRRASMPHPDRED